MRSESLVKTSKHFIYHRATAGFTLLALLLFQLAWPLPISAQKGDPADKLRTSIEGVQAGLGGTLHRATGLEEPDEYIFHLAAAFSTASASFQSDVRDVVIPALFGMKPSGEKIAPEDMGRLDEQLFRVLAKITRTILPF